MDIAVLLTLIAAGLFSVGLWWYWRTPLEGSGHAGRTLWVAWVAFGIVSLVILAASGLEAVLLGGAVTWAFCLAGTVLGSRLLIRSFRNREQDIWALTLVFALGYALLGFLFVLFLMRSAFPLLNTS